MIKLDTIFVVLIVGKWREQDNNICFNYIMDNLRYETNLETLLKQQAEICESMSILHRNSHNKFNNYTNGINIPVIILSSVVGFATGIDINYSNMNIILGIMSVGIGIIKSLDSYFQLGKRSETHRIVSLQYGQINKKIAIELALHRKDRINPKDILNIIKTDIKNLEDIAPLIPDDIIEAYKVKYPETDNLVKRPNICNGLTPVIVNVDELERTVNSRRNTNDGEILEA